MKNSIEAHIELSFKGETFSLSSTIDLDNLPERSDIFSSAHALLAKQHGIDTYSYLYEVMLEEPIEFRNAQGSAAGFLMDGEFDAQAFLADCQNRRIFTQLQPIAARELGITDLDQHDALRTALLQAYQLGKESR